MQRRTVSHFNDKIYCWCMIDNVSCNTQEKKKRKQWFVYSLDLLPVCIINRVIVRCRVFLWNISSYLQGGVSILARNLLSAPSLSVLFLNTVYNLFLLLLLRGGFHLLSPSPFTCTNPYLISFSCLLRPPQSCVKDISRSCPDSIHWSVKDFSNMPVEKQRMILPNPTASFFLSFFLVS